MPEAYLTKVWGVLCGNTDAPWLIISDVQCKLTLNRGGTFGLPAHGCSYVNVLEATCWANVCISWSWNGYDCRIHIFFQNQLLTCAHPQMSGIAHCLLDKPVVGDLAESQVHMVASFLPCWSCQSHILLSATEWLKILSTTLQGCDPEPQH